MVRVSGPDARRVAEEVCPGLEGAPPRRATLVWVIGSDGRRIDRAVATLFPGPASYTGEDVVELTVHGSPVIVERVVREVVRVGGREAERGEFTRRAVVNGKMDLAQAEGVRDLIDAETEGEAALALGHAEGLLSRRVEGLRDELIDLLAGIEASLDFSTEETGVAADQHEAGRRRCLEAAVGLAATRGWARRLTEGTRVVILGRPNAGKSTLFNELLGTDRAIVSPAPGTTRDVVDGDTEIGGRKVVLVDTAGLRVAGAEVEREGVRRAEEEIRRAGAGLLLWAADDPEGPPRVPDGTDMEVLRLWTKTDLVGSGAVPPGWLPVSVRHGRGLEEVRAWVRDRVAAEAPDGVPGGVGVTERQREALEEAASALTEWPAGELELAAEHVRRAVEAVGRITGRVTSDEVLDRVFDTFCLGK